MPDKNKRFYWIKLRTDFFQEDGPIDFLMSQANGSQYVMLYLMLCQKTANNGGALYTTIGETYIPYDINKIVRDTKYFDYDTVSIALQLFIKLGLIFETFTDNNFQFLQISNFENMVGSESANPAAIRKREERARKELASKNVTNCHKLVATENHEEIRDIDNNIYIYNARAREENLESPETREIIDSFNTICGSLTQQKIYLTSKRRKKIENLLLRHDVAEIKKVFGMIMQSDYLTGKGKEGWKASFDWILVEDNYYKVLEGNYCNKITNTPGKTKDTNKARAKPGFNNFSQRDDDLDALEKKLLGF